MFFGIFVCGLLQSFVVNVCTLWLNSTKVNWNTEYKSESYKYTMKTITKIMSGLVTDTRNISTLWFNYPGCALFAILSSTAHVLLN